MVNPLNVARDLVNTTSAAQAQLRDGLESIREEVRRVHKQVEEVRALPCTLDIALHRAERLVLASVEGMRSQVRRFSDVKVLTQAEGSVVPSFPVNEQRIDMLFATRRR